MTNNINTKQRGFTIVELLIVIVVIAILAAISIGMYLGIQQRARDAQRTSEVNQIAKALTAFASEESFGGWSTIDTVDEAAADPPTATTGLLRSYTTVQTPGEVLDKLQATQPADANGGYGYVVCEAGGVGTGATGIELSWWKEGADGTAADPNVQTTNVGTGC